MPSYDSSLQLAYNGLVKCPAHLKHIVVISDGDAAQPNPALAKKIVDAGITISAVCVAPHQPSDAQSLQMLARWGNGRFYQRAEGDVESLPAIFIKEATTLRRNAILRSSFTPELTTSGPDLPEALAGFRNPLPALGTHTVTEAKERAEVVIVSPGADPVLAFWRYGIGRSAAFTSSARGDWLGEWEGWADLDRFFSQVVRSCFRQAGRSGFNARAEAQGGVATVQISAVSEGGEELDFIDMEGVAVRPGEEPRKFMVLQKGGGLYEGSFPVRGEGTTVAIVRYRDPATGEPTQLEVPVAVAYPEEYAALETDQALIARLFSEAGARILTGDEDVFGGESDTALGTRSFAKLLLLLAAFLLPLDVFLRRIRFDFGAVLGRLRPARREAAVGKRKALVAEKPIPSPMPTEVAEEAAGAESASESASEEPSEEDRIGGLLKAKKRAKDKRKWEETGQ
jgi:hypothetical protein